jgi:bifunctional DNA-binding transcriptional regulator/antitoxin component of YhaV-PrlF toxin-antitoxin module
MPYERRMNRMVKLKITAKGQVTLRKEVLQDLGVTVGDNLNLEKLPDGRYAIGSAPKGKITDAFGILKRPGQRPVSIEEMNEVIADSWAGKR